MPSRRLVLISCSVVAATGMLLGGAAITVRCKADARWNEMEAWVAQARTDYQRRDFHRQVAWGASRPELAFPHYRRALQLATTLSTKSDTLVQLWDEIALRKLPRGAQPLTPAEVSAIHAAWAPAVAELDQGAHCADARPWLDLEQPVPSTNLLAVRWLTDLAVIEAIDALQAQEPLRAVEMLLDALTLGTDLMRSVHFDRMIGSAGASIVLMQGLAEERLSLLDRAALDLLAEGLLRLDDAMLADVSLPDEVLETACWMQRHGDKLDSSWRFGFSRRWQAAEAVLGMAGESTRLRDVQPSWPAREAVLDRLEQDSCADRSFRWLGTRTSEQGVRQALAQLRMLRLSVDHHRGMALPELADPLGEGPLAVEPREDGLCIASAGKVSGQRMERIAVR